MCPNTAEATGLYPDLEHFERTQLVALAVKRGIDIVGSAVAIILFTPLFALIAILVKLGSKGPVLFRQERVGQFGGLFMFLKFRSMYANNDPKIHQEFMRRVISGDVKKESKIENVPESPKSGASFASHASMNCHNSSAFSKATCRWLVHVRQSHTSARSTPFGTAAACSK
jgi:hypothetical protein